MSTPSIACIGVIGKHDNPLHITVFPPYAPPESSEPSQEAKTNPKDRALFTRNYLDFSFFLNASLDIFDARARDRNRTDQDLGLLQHIDERLSLWGWLTGTGVKFVIMVDAWGKDGGGGTGLGSSSKPKDLERSATGSASFKSESGSKKGKGDGKAVGDADLRPAFKALQTSYIRLLQNPFYVPDEHSPVAVAQGKGKGGAITSRKFIQEVRRIGDVWKPGLSTV